MTTINRPNKDALGRAIDIFRDAMRPFLVHCLRSVPGATLEETVTRSLPPSQANQFVHTLRNAGNDVQAAIDIAYFPHLVSKNWDAFRRRLTMTEPLGTSYGSSCAREIKWRIPASKTSTQTMPLRTCST